MITLHHQNFMLSLRAEMGWPEFKPTNDSIAWTSGRAMDVQLGLELGRIAQMIGKDLVYSGWTSARAAEPTSLTIAWRDLLTVDIFDRLVPFAANDDAPIVLVSTRADETFAIDRRGSLVRIPGKPKSIGAGRKRAMKRIRATASTISDVILSDNRWVPTGATSIGPDEAVETIVRFG